MKRLAPLAPLALAAALATQPGCYGTYSAFRSVNHWNGQVTNNKIANSVIHFGLWVIPVYEIVLMGDFWIFNTIEFFTDKPVFSPG